MAKWLENKQANVYSGKLVASVVDEMDGISYELKPFHAGAIIGIASSYHLTESKPAGRPGALFPPPCYVIQFRDATGEILLNLQIGYEGSWLMIEHVPTGRLKRYLDDGRLGHNLLKAIAESKSN